MRALSCYHHNKANRVYFDQSSPNGILLFWVIGDVVCAYGRRLLANPMQTCTELDVYKTGKREWAVGGNCVCFGVFSLYNNDPALENSFKMALQMTLTRNSTDSLRFTFANHSKTVRGLDMTVNRDWRNALFFFLFQFNVDPEFVKKNLQTSNIAIMQCLWSTTCCRHQAIFPQGIAYW
jgi:hypothetical protein